jgi:hypothetical protein
MHKSVGVLLLVGFLIVPARVSSLAGKNNPELQQLKQRHKEERNALKTKERYEKTAMKGQVVSRAVRYQMKHQRQREARELRERQKDELQDLKDRQKLVKESQRFQ